MVLYFKELNPHIYVGANSNVSLLLYDSSWREMLENMQFFWSTLWKCWWASYWLDVNLLGSYVKLKESQIYLLICFTVSRPSSPSFWAKRWLITLYFITVTVIFIICKWIKSLINSWDWSTTLFTKYSSLLSCVLSHVVKTATHFSLLAFRILAKYFQINLWNKLT